ncbi:hypothetical protein K7432_000399 [Basidiobolus ranarum]|uniref:Pentatricopeptide repeat-containing protein n=1 Tax=Basidiobolus ranarum TaxID=34480 RepID=A0ABR2X529_9FUNG
MLPWNLRKLGLRIKLCTPRRLRLIPVVPRLVNSFVNFDLNSSRCISSSAVDNYSHSVPSRNLSSIPLELLSVYINRQDLFHAWDIVSNVEPSLRDRIPQDVQYKLLLLLHKVRDPHNLDKMLSLLPHIHEYKEKAYITIIQKACHQKKFELAMDLIQKMVKGGLTPTAKTIHVLVTKLTEDSQEIHAQQLVSSLSKLKPGLPITVYAQLREALDQKGVTLEDIRKIIHRATVPISFLFFLGISHFAALGKYKEAGIIFEDMIDANVCPNISIFTELMKAHYKGSDQAGCIQTFQRMQHSGITADVKAYSLLMQSYGAAGNHKTAMKLFNRMLRIGLFPDIQAFSIITKIMVDHYQHDDAIQVFEVLGRSGMSRNLHYYNAILYAFDQKYGTLGISKVVQLMAEQEAKPNVYIYTSMINLYAKSLDLATAVRLFEEMRKSGITPNHVTYGALIDGFAKTSNLQAIKDLEKRMMMDKIRPDTVLMNTIMDAYNRLGDGEKVLELWHSFPKFSLAPDSATLSIFLDSCTFNNQIEPGYQVMQDVLKRQLGRERSKITLERRNFQRYFNLLAKKGDFEQFIPTLETMNMLQVIPAKGNILLLLSHLIYAERDDLAKQAKRLIAAWCPAVLPKDQEIDRFLVDYRPLNE